MNESRTPKVINGYWDGRPIYREKEPGEKMLDAIRANPSEAQAKDLAEPSGLEEMSEAEATTRKEEIL